MIDDDYDGGDGDGGGGGDGGIQTELICISGRSVDKNIDFFFVMERG